jgi:hypothetical protein
VRGPSRESLRVTAKFHVKGSHAMALFARRIAQRAVNGGEEHGGSL